jgi:hypothetical protein
VGQAADRLEAKLTRPCALEVLALKLTDETINGAVLSLSATELAEVDALMLELASRPTNDPTASTRPCSLAKDPGHPGDNWVTRAGGLPTYICNMAKAIKKKGMTTSKAIAIAVGRMDNLIATSKNPQVKEEASKAKAEWEADRAKAHATVKAAHAMVSH